MARKFDEDMVRFKQYIEAVWAKERGPAVEPVSISAEAVRAAARDSLVPA
jgi:hypothetical protein